MKMFGVWKCFASIEQLLKEMNGHCIRSLHSLRSLISINFDFLDCEPTKADTIQNRTLLNGPLLRMLLLQLLCLFYGKCSTVLTCVLCNSMRSYYTKTTNIIDNNPKCNLYVLNIRNICCILVDRQNGHDFEFDILEFVYFFLLVRTYSRNGVQLHDNEASEKKSRIFFLLFFVLLFQKNLVLLQFTEID